jgi:phage tail-like protein
MAARKQAVHKTERRPVRGRSRTPAAPPAFSRAHFRVFIGAREVGFCEITRLHAADAEATATAADVPPQPSVVLRRAITQSKDLYLWRQRAAAGKAERRTVTIQQCDASGRTVLNTWVLHGCRPVRWSGPEFNALSSDILWEEIEIRCERLEWV